jgi:two-component system, cell cycle sensor histidine kinase and response regulator CckA
MHRDPARLALAQQYARRYPLVRRSGVGTPSTLTTGRPHVVPRVTDELLMAVATNTDELALLRAFEIRSLMLVPLLARRRILGMLVLATAESGRIFGDADVTLAEDLASRAALAVDNARLYQAEQQARAEAEAALHARIDGERQFQALLDHSPALMCVIDTEGRLTLVNREYEARTGLDKRQLIGRTMFDLLTPATAEEVVGHDRRVLTEKRPLQFESTYVYRGERRSWFTLKFPIIDDDGVVRGLGGIATDITERRQADEALRSSQERFEKVFRASTISISVTRLSDGHFVEVNAACEKLTGYRADEMLGRTGTELGFWARPEDRVRAVAMLETEGRVSGFETTLRDRAGRIHDVLMSIEAIELGGERCILALAHDITDLKRLNERLEQAQRMEALGRLAGGVAHDFNNILTAISGYSTVLVEAVAPDSPLHGSAAHIQRAATRATALIEQLLVFGRQRVHQATVVELNAVVAGVLTMLRRLIGEDVQLETRLAPDVGCVEIDPARLEQVVLNLALNARDAMPAGGRLCIETAVDRDDDGARCVRLTVEDDGVGMDEATRARIFEPFFTTKEVGKGTGLGLATVYGIVQQAGGRIAVRSELGHGARFDVMLPPATRAPGATEANGRDVEPAGGQGTLLVVEDDESVCEFVCMVLRQASYHILTASDGEAALAIAAQHRGRLDLLVTDIVMPRCNGRALANRLRQDFPRLRVMYMSGYPGDTIQRYDAIPQGDAFLQKPFTRELLLKKVAEALRRS